MAPYALLEPALIFVVEDHEGVADVVAGTEDAVAWENRRAIPFWRSLAFEELTLDDVPEGRTL